MKATTTDKVMICPSRMSVTNLLNAGLEVRLSKKEIPDSREWWAYSASVRLLTPTGNDVMLIAGPEKVTSGARATRDRTSGRDPNIGISRRDDNEDELFEEVEAATVSIEELLCKAVTACNDC